MDKLNVLLVSPMDLSDDFAKTIADLDPRISVKDGSVQFLEELKQQGKKGMFLDIMGRRASRIKARNLPESTESLDSLLAEAEVVFGIVIFPEKLFARAPKLKWIQIGSIGMDGYKAQGIFDGNAIVTNGKGSQSIPIAEYVIGYMFMLSKDARQLLENQKNKKWDPFPSQELREKTVGIIGLGSIGSEVAKLAKGLGMRVVATRRSAVKRESNVQGVDELYPPSSMKEVLAQSDYVVISVPRTPETQKIIGEAELRSMKPSAYFINIARGENVDQAVLIRALKEGWIAGAGLDVFEKEPLPPENELWEMQNVIVSSHASGASPRRGDYVIKLFGENVKRYIDGKQLMNVVDMNKGY